MKMFLNKIKNFIIKYWHLLVLIIVAICFFIVTASFNYFSQTIYVNNQRVYKWLSPDETANYIFAKLYGQESKLSFFEKYNLYADDIIHPRSFRSDSGWLKPVSFLGLPLIYGQIIKLIGYKSLPFLTPFVAAVGLIFYYLLIRKFFGKTNALISTLLMASFPVYVYYSARSMFHNVLFMVLLIIALYYAILMVRRKKKINDENLFKYETFAIKPYIFSALSGSFFGLAIITRTSELIWLLPLLLILWIGNIKKIGLTKLIIFLGFVFLCLLPVMYWNQTLYSSFWRGGYNEMNQSIVNITEASAGLVQSSVSGNFGYVKEFLQKLKSNIFYFGLEPKQSLKMLYHYFIVMFYWFFIPAVLGGIIFLTKIKQWRKKHWLYLMAYFFISLILILYYGSWGFHDNPKATSFTIGNSYTRYWLPIYLGGIPFVSLFIVKLTKLFKKKVLIYAARIVLIALVSFISLNFVLYGSEEGLIISFKQLKNYNQELTKVLNLTEDNSVIITRYHDKVFFPERKVIVGLFDDNTMNQNYANLVKVLPVYYYNFTFTEKDFNYLNNNRLKEVGLQIQQVSQVTKDFTLYKLSLSTPLIKGSLRPKGGAGDF